MMHKQLGAEKTTHIRNIHWGHIARESLRGAPSGTPPCSEASTIQLI